MGRALFGLETELALAFEEGEEERDSREANLLLGLLALVGRRAPALSGMQGSGWFLANGSRFYVDSGNHPEWCTPECSHPADLVRWQLAGERFLGGLCRELAKQQPGSAPELFRCNVDYGGTGSTWGCHESYQHRGHTEEMLAHLVPHLVTRIVYTGAGGFSNRDARLRFQLSPRVPHLLSEYGEDTVSGRSIYNGRDEPLSAGGYRRLHLICGESLCSQLANYLKVGSTALVVGLIDAGRCRGDALSFRSSVRAMRKFSSDPSLKARCLGRDGRRRSALEVQRAYLEMVEGELGSGVLPDWAPELCRRWREVLDGLERDPAALATCLDWSIKRALFREQLERAGCSWQGLEPGRGLGAELCEIDTRFGALGGGGIFDALDGAGALDHALVEPASVEEAVAAPPPGGRAEARGRAIASLAGQGGRYLANWDAIVDRQASRVLDLSDPFVREPAWRESARPEPRPGSAEQRRIDRLIGEGQSAYGDMGAARAVRRLERAIALAGAEAETEREALARFWCAGAYNDLARLEQAERVLVPVLAERRAIRASTRCRLATRLAVVRIEAAAGEGRLVEAMALVQAACEVTAGEQGRSRATLLEGRLLLLRGRCADALPTLERALAETRSDPIAFARASYLRWLVEAALGAGDLDRVRALLDRWRPIAASSYRGITLHCSESALALREGRAEQALARAETALRLARPFPHHRCTLEAGLAVFEAAREAGQRRRAASARRGLRRWREVEIAALRDRVAAALA